MIIDPETPFVILDDAGGDGTRPAQLFAAPRHIVTAATRADIPAALATMRKWHAKGKHLAGYLGYDAGAHFEPRLASTLSPRPGRGPLLWFGIFDDVRHVAPGAILEPVAQRRAQVHAVVPRLSRARYDRAIARCKTLISAGDIYQVNLTFEADIGFSGHPLALYSRLRKAQKMAYGAVIWTGDAWVLSASPELFFRLEDDALSTKPMKGTAARQPRGADDKLAAVALARDPKNRAENLMITDLLRNDLARIARPGSVSVENAFRVETYPTVHQMTSTVRAGLADGLGPFDVLEAIFPCGSITGAPKIRAMEVIDMIERRARGLYTGAIGRISPRNNAVFNVAIRTIECAGNSDTAVDGARSGTMGVGSGLIADSEAAAEWDECIQKLAFATHRARSFHLIETMAFRSPRGIDNIALHIDRLERSAAYFGFACDRHEILNLLQAVVGQMTSDKRIKLTLAASGHVGISSAPLPAPPSGPVPVKIVPLGVDTDDPRLFHKTSDREFHDLARARSGVFEVLFVRPDGYLTEGSFTSLFVPSAGFLCTPPESDGLLPGIFRQTQLQRGKARERRLRAKDLRDDFFIGNSARGLIPATLA